MKNNSQGFVPIVVILVVLALVGAAYYFGTLKTQPTYISESPTPAISPTPSVKPTPNSTTKPVLTPTPTPTPSPRPFSEEEPLMRKTLAGYEGYIGVSNTAGALTFFTSPMSQQAKEKYGSIRNKNLPYGLKSWSFVMNTAGILSAEEIKGGYRVRVNECRTNSDTCITLSFELVRNNSAENGFLVDRYYTSQYMYQNNLGEEIKYQGFGF